MNSSKRQPRGTYLYLKDDDEIEVQLLPGVNDIEEIISIKLRVNENDNLDIISKALALDLGCKITKENGMELLKGKPVGICGTTILSIRLPTTSKQVTKEFIKINMRISEQLDTHIMISNESKSKLGLLPFNGGRKVFYQDFKRYKKKIKRVK